MSNVTIPASLYRRFVPLQIRVVRNARKRGVVVLTRKQWGSLYPHIYKERRKTHPVTVKEADTLWQHITVTFDSGELIGDFKADMRTIERIGVERFGSGFSYNAAVDMKTGMVGMGQDLLTKGTHTVNDKSVKGFSFDQNAVARAVAFLGMPGDKLSLVAREATAQFIAAMIDEGALTLSFDYVPHSLVAYKDCPTDAGRAAMPWILKRALQVTVRR